MRPHGRGGLTLACRLLPRSVRADVFALYGVFRAIDDAVDEGDPSAPARVAAVQGWCRTGAVASRETAVLADVAARRALPREALLEFCRGMRHDLEGRTMATEQDLDRYCHRVAGTVGLTVAAVLEAREPCAREAGLLGIALQRTNVLRDLDEDLAAGRCYVPATTLARCGPPEPGGREALVREWVARADALYDAGLAGVPSLRRGRWAIAAAAFTYREILRQVERDGLGRRPGRAVVPRWRRLLAVARAGAWLGPALARRRGGSAAASARLPSDRVSSSSASA